MLKQLKADHLYMIIDIKEPYIEKIFEVLKAGQLEKEDWPEGSSINFREWVEKTFGQTGVDYIGEIND